MVVTSKEGEGAKDLIKHDIALFFSVFDSSIRSNIKDEEIKFVVDL